MNKDLDSKVHSDITFLYGPVRGSFSLRVCVAFWVSRDQREVSQISATLSTYAEPY